MRLLDRYIFRQVFVTCAACVGFFVFLIAAVNAIKDLLGVLLAGQLAPESAAKLMLLLIPYVVMYALPMGMLLGVLLVLGRLSADSELVAMRACGVGLRRITAPIYVLAFLGVLLGLAVNHRFMPMARTMYQKEFSQMLRTNAMRLIVPKTFIRDFPQSVVYVGEKAGDYVRNIWFWRLDKDQRVSGFFHADTGRIELDEARNELVLTPFGITTERYDEKDPEDFSEPPSQADAESTSFRISLSRLTGGRAVRHKAKWFTPEELKAERERLAATLPAGRERERELMRLDMIVQDRGAMSLAVLTLVFIAVPLGIRFSRRETSANFGVALLLTMVYYFSTIVVGWFDKSPELRPDLLVWAPNVVFAGIGLWLYLRTERA